MAIFSSRNLRAAVAGIAAGLGSGCMEQNSCQDLELLDGLTRSVCRSQDLLRDKLESRYPDVHSLGFPDSDFDRFSDRALVQELIFPKNQLSLSREVIFGVIGDGADIGGVYFGERRFQELCGTEQIQNPPGCHQNYHETEVLSTLATYLPDGPNTVIMSCLAGDRLLPRWLTTDQMADQLEALKQNGAHFINLSYDVWPTDEAEYIHNKASYDRLFSAMKDYLRGGGVLVVTLHNNHDEDRSYAAQFMDEIAQESTGRLVVVGWLADIGANLEKVENLGTRPGSASDHVVFVDAELVIRQRSRTIDENGQYVGDASYSIGAASGSSFSAPWMIVNAARALALRPELSAVQACDLVLQGATTELIDTDGDIIRYMPIADPRVLVHYPQIFARLDQASTLLLDTYPDRERVFADYYAQVPSFTNTNEEYAQLDESPCIEDKTVAPERTVEIGGRKRGD